MGPRRIVPVGDLAGQHRVIGETSASPSLPDATHLSSILSVLSSHIAAGNASAALGLADFLTKSLDGLIDIQSGNVDLSGRGSSGFSFPDWNGKLGGGGYLDIDPLGLVAGDSHSSPSGAGGAGQSGGSTVREQWQLSLDKIRQNIAEAAMKLEAQRSADSPY